jgi:ribosomal-protein-alanine N-acetyltransferase
MVAMINPWQIRFRTMRREDVTEVVAIESRVTPYPWTHGNYRDCLRMGYGAWIIEREHRIAAFGVMSYAVDEAHILNLCVNPDFQREGLGRVMLNYLMDTAARWKAAVIFLEVRPSNRVACRLYQQAGFAEVGIRAGYYPAAKGREDALILAKQLWMPE